MTAFQWFQVLQSLVMLIGTVLIFLWGRTQAQQQALFESRYLGLTREVQALVTRLDHAGQKQSDLVNTVNGLPERMRAVFLPLDRADDMNAESKQDRQRLWDAVNRLSAGGEKGHRGEP